MANKKRIYILIDEDIYKYLTFKNNSRRGISKLIEGFLMDSLAFRSEFGMFLAFPKSKPKMVKDWEEKKEDDKKTKRRPTKSN